jgi:hypothetical protein
MNYKSLKYEVIPGTKHYVMKTYRSTEVKLRSFLISAMDRKLYAVSHCSRFTLGERFIGCEVW